MKPEVNAQQKSRVLIIDDHPLFRRGVQQLLSMDPYFECVGEAANGDTGQQLAHELRPDLILLDINLPPSNGIDVLKNLRKEEIESAVVMLTVNDNALDLVAAIKADADGYVLKDMEPMELLAKLTEAERGKMVIDPSLTQLMISVLQNDSHIRAETISDLTPREIDVLSCVARGSSNKVIARKLNICDSTVKVHMKSILRKLNLANRLEAAIWALNHDVG